MTPYAEASAAYHYDFDFVEMHFNNMRLVKPDENTFEFQIVQIGKDEIVARLDVEITAEAGAHFRYYLYDEGDQVGIGDSSERLHSQVSEFPNFAAPQTRPDLFPHFSMKWNLN